MVRPHHTHIIDGFGVDLHEDNDGEKSKKTRLLGSPLPSRLPHQSKHCSAFNPHQLVHVLQPIYVIEYRLFSNAIVASFQLEIKKIYISIYLLYFAGYNYNFQVSLKFPDLVEIFFSMTFQHSILSLALLKPASLASLPWCPFRMARDYITNKLFGKERLRLV